MYIIISKTDSQWEFAVWLRGLKQGLCAKPREVGWGGKFRREKHRYIPMADSC